ncbi:MAG: tetratricopeptide repeat protein [Planctomycetaceae bacterium]
MRSAISSCLLICACLASGSAAEGQSGQRFSSPTQSSRIWNQAFRGTGSQYLSARGVMGGSIPRSVIPIPYRGGLSQIHSASTWQSNHSWGLQQTSQFSSTTVSSHGHGVIRRGVGDYFPPQPWNAGGLPWGWSRNGLYTTIPGTTQLIPLEWWWNGSLGCYTNWYTNPWLQRTGISIGISQTPVQQVVVADQSPAPMKLQAQQVPFNAPLQLNEFPELPGLAGVAAGNEVAALRKQAAGDAAFRTDQLQLADLHYRTAQELNPNSAPLLVRRVLLGISQQSWATAFNHLQQLLSLSDHSSAITIVPSEIYGPTAAKKEIQLSEPLWDWLEQNPNSADRLLLMAAFQAFHGRQSLSQELLQQLASIPETAEQAQRLGQIVGKITVSELDQPMIAGGANPAKQIGKQVSAEQPAQGITIRGDRRILEEKDAIAD